MKSNKFSIVLIFFIVFSLAVSCKRDPNKKIIEQDLSKRIEKRAQTGEGGLFGNLGRSNTFEFSTSNLLWRAALETLDFVPLNSVNYSGGVIVSDWYSSQLNSLESIKIEIRFLSNEIKASSVRVISYKKTCKQNTSSVCTIKKLNKSFNQKIHNSIMLKAKDMKIAEAEAKEEKLKNQ